MFVNTEQSRRLLGVNLKSTRSSLLSSADWWHLAGRGRLPGTDRNPPGNAWTRRSAHDSAVQHSELADMAALRRLHCCIITQFRTWRVSPNFWAKQIKENRDGRQDGRVYKRLRGGCAGVVTRSASSSRPAALERGRGAGARGRGAAWCARAARTRSH